MHLVHHSACVFTIPAMTIMPELARTQSGHAPALIPTHEAGRRGGESIARQSENYKSNSLALKADAP